MRHATLIDQLGGYMKVAAEVGRDKSTVWRWANTGGIPPEWWVPMVQLAKRQGIAITTEQLAKHSPYAAKVRIKPAKTGR